MTNLLIRILSSLRNFIEKYAPSFVEFLSDCIIYLDNELEREKPIIIDPHINVESIPVVTLPEYNSLFFDSFEEEQRFFSYICTYLNDGKVRPELAFYMLCSDKRIPSLRIHNDLINFSKKSNSVVFLDSLRGYHKLYSFLFNVSSSLDLSHSKVFSGYLNILLFEKGATFEFARYNSSFREFAKSSTI